MDYKLLILILSFIEASVEQRGNSEIFQIGPGVFKTTKTQAKANMIFLSQDSAIYDGILAGFTVYLIHDSLVELQIWRPVNSSKSRFKLISTYPYTRASGLREYQDIYIKSLTDNKECIRVAKGDKIGIFFRETVWPIPYIFVEDNSPEALRSLVLDLKGKDTYNEIQTIDELIFPYQFSAVARVLNFSSLPGDFNPDIKQTDGCPDIVFPYLWGTTTSTSTAVPRTPPMGFTGATGATGAAGPKGFAGSTGAMGVDGSKGATGERGPIGATGSIGTGGMKGGVGHEGVKGLPGSTGSSGSTGATGPVGIPGPPGKNGTDAVSPAAGPGINSPSQMTVWRWWRSKNLIVGLYAWSVILSVLLIAVLLCSVVLLVKVKNEKDKSL